MRLATPLAFAKLIVLGILLNDRQFSNIRSAAPEEELEYVPCPRASKSMSEGISTSDVQSEKRPSPLKGA